MTPGEALKNALSLPQWRDLGGLDADTIYGELAMDVARIAIAAEREACARMEWQPIATAPDFGPVLVWVPKINRGLDSAEVVIILRDDDGALTYWTNGGPNGGSDMDFEYAPTHWMPLPPLPEMSANQ